MTSDIRIQDALSAVTDAIITGEGDVDVILRRYDVNRDEIESVMPLINGLNRTLTPVQPGAQFSTSLKAELMGSKPETSLTWRIRKLPARVQIAAATALIWGAIMIVWQRFAGSGDDHRSSEKAAQEKA